MTSSLMNHHNFSSEPRHLVTYLNKHSVRTSSLNVFNQNRSDLDDLFNHDLTILQFDL